MAILLLLATMGCDDIIVTDISNQEIQIISPIDDLQSEKATIGFLWEELDGASQYQLQIVSPSFDAISELLEDSLMSTTYYEGVFASGSYQWRLKALNNGYETAYTMPMNFTVTDSISPLSPEGFSLNEPANNAIVNGDQLTFRWQEISGATQYVFKLEGYAEYTDTVAVAVLEKSVDLADGIYQWYVVAKNTGAQIKSEVQQFELDGTAPFAPNLQYPLAGDSLSLGDTIQWQRTSEDVQYDKLFLYTDAAANNLVNTFPKELATPSFILAEDLALQMGESYYYQLLSTDKAQNESVLSPITAFYVKEN